MGHEITLTGEQGYLTIEINSYENISAIDAHDANWLASTISLKAEPFSGAFRASLTTRDLISLYEQLKKALEHLSQTTTFQSIEGNLSLSIEFDKRGTAAITGVVQPPPARAAQALHFRLDTDQSALTQTLRQLEDAQRRFPVK